MYLQLINLATRKDSGLEKDGFGFVRCVAGVCLRCTFFFWVENNIYIDYSCCLAKKLSQGKFFATHVEVIGV